MFLFCFFFTFLYFSAQTASMRDVGNLSSTSLPQTASHTQRSVTSSWLGNYKVPTFPDTLKDKIESGNSSASRDSTILDILFESVKPYTL